VLKDYDSKMFYHLVKANVVADALSKCIVIERVTLKCSQSDW
jgi:hypothetical protein